METATIKTTSGITVWCRFISGGCGSVDYAVGPISSNKETRVSVKDDGRYCAMGCKDAGLSFTDCMEAVKGFKEQSHAEYLEWRKSHPQYFAAVIA